MNLTRPLGDPLTPKEVIDFLTMARAQIKKIPIPEKDELVERTTEALNAFKSGSYDKAQVVGSLVYVYDTLDVFRKTLDEQSQLRSHVRDTCKKIRRATKTIHQNL